MSVIDKLKEQIVDFFHTVKYAHSFITTPKFGLTDAQINECDIIEQLYESCIRAVRFYGLLGFDVNIEQVKTLKEEYVVQYGKGDNWVDYQQGIFREYNDALVCKNILEKGKLVCEEYSKEKSIPYKEGSYRIIKRVIKDISYY